jgi:hypothetical protein
MGTRKVEYTCSILHFGMLLRSCVIHDTCTQFSGIVMLIIKVSFHVHNPINWYNFLINNILNAVTSLVSMIKRMLLTIQAKIKVKSIGLML